MKKLALLLLLLPTVALADSGDPCDPGIVTEVPEDAGISTKARAFCRVLVDGVTSATGGPVGVNIFDFPSKKLAKFNLPDHLVFKLVLNDCTAGTISLTHAEAAAGLENIYSGPASAIGLGAGAVTRVEPTDKAPGNFAMARWADVVCPVGANGATVYIMGYVEARR